MVVPVAKALTSPVALMVAALVLLLLHVPPVVVSVNWDVLPTHTLKVPPIAATTGTALTVTAAVDTVKQPLLLVTV